MRKVPLPVPNGKPMTPSLWRMLQLVADHGNPMKVAAHEHYSYWTVKNVLADARQRLGARNTTHAVTIAFFMGKVR